MSNVRQQLIDVAKIAQDEGEDEQTFLRRLYQKINGVKDEQWGKLSTEAQQWQLAAGQAIEKGESIPVPNGKAKPPAKKTAVKLSARDGTVTMGKKPPAKKAAPKKAPAKAAKKTTLGRPRIPDGTKIKKLVDELPPGNRNAHWDKVKDGATIKSIRDTKTLLRACRYWRRNKFVDFVKA